MDFFLDPLKYSFMVRGLLGGLLVALACSTLSAFVVWRRMSFIGDAISHAILPGIVIAYALGASLFLGALGAAVFIVLAIGLLSRKGQMNEDVAIGVVFVGCFSLGILLLSRLATTKDLTHILFGNILGISGDDLISMVVVVAVVLITVLLSYKEMVLASFDSSHATAIGLSPEFVRYLILSLLALTTVVAIQTVGIVLVLALLITPAAIASLLSRNLPRIMGLALFFALIATLVGFYASYYLDFPSGPVIVLTLCAFFLVATLIRWLKKRSYRRLS